MSRTTVEVSGRQWHSKFCLRRCFWNKFLCNSAANVFKRHGFWRSGYVFLTSIHSASPRNCCRNRDSNMTSSPQLFLTKADLQIHDWSVFCLSEKPPIHSGWLHWRCQKNYEEKIHIVCASWSTQRTRSAQDTRHVTFFSLSWSSLLEFQRVETTPSNPTCNQKIQKDMVVSLITRRWRTKLCGCRRPTSWCWTKVSWVRFLLTEKLD